MRRCRARVPSPCGWTRSARSPPCAGPRVVWVGLDAPPALELLQDRLERQIGGDRIRARGHAVPPPRHAGTGARGPAAAAGRAGEFGGPVRAGAVPRLRAGSLRKRARPAVDPATSRASRWSWHRDGLHHRTVQAARLPGPDHRCLASASCTATGWSWRPAESSSGSRGPFRRPAAGRASARWSRPRRRSTRSTDGGPIRSCLPRRSSLRWSGTGWIRRCGVSSTRCRCSCWTARSRSARGFAPGRCRRR